MDNYSPRTKMMIDKLADQSARGNIKDEWTENFIWDIKKKFDTGHCSFAFSNGWKSG